MDRAEKRMDLHDREMEALNAALRERMDRADRAWKTSASNFRPCAN
jgi:hypothetical protein